MITTDQIRNQIVGYIVGEVRLSDFEDWFVANSWNAHQNSSNDAQELVFVVEARLAEFSSSDQIDEAALRASLAELVREYSVHVALGEGEVACDRALTTTTGSSQSAMPAGVKQIVSVDIRSAMVSA